MPLQLVHKALHVGIHTYFTFMLILSYIYVCMNVCTYVYIYMYIYTFLVEYIYIFYLYVCTYIYIYIHMYFGFSLADPGLQEADIGTQTRGALSSGAGHPIGRGGSAVMIESSFETQSFPKS